MLREEPEELNTCAREVTSTGGGLSVIDDAKVPVRRACLDGPLKEMYTGSPFERRSAGQHTIKKIIDVLLIKGP